MIAYLRGRVIDIGAETLVLEVNGVGYELYCSASVFSKARFGAEIELYVSMHRKKKSCLRGSRPYRASARKARWGYSPPCRRTRLQKRLCWRT